MAKTAAAKTEGVPSFLDSEGEAHPFLKACKEAVGKKFSLKSSDSLYGAMDLAFYLAALGRAADAAEVCGYIASNVVFAGNFNLWSPAGKSFCLKARLLREAGQAAEADAALQPIIAVPFKKTPPQEEIDRDLAALSGEVHKALAGPKKTACSFAARKLYSACWYLEVAQAKVPGFSGVPTAKLESEWKLGMQKLAAKLNG